MLLLTYHRLDKVENLVNEVICCDHWREWYDYNTKIKLLLKPFLEQSPRKTLFADADADAGNLNLSTQTIFLNIFDSDDCAFNIFKRLNVFELKKLALSCKFFNKKVKDYLGSDEKIWQRLMTGFFVDRAFVDKAPVEALKVMFNYIFRMRDRHINNENVNLTSIFDIISNEQENSLGSNSELKSILSFFGVMRKPRSMEIVVYATAKLLKDTFRNYHLSHNSTDIEKLPLTCFRVGVEVLLLIFDLVLTGKEENITQLKIENIKSLLFKCLAINSVREKMCDFKTITPFHAVLSNEASLTCSKSLLNLLNRCGISHFHIQKI